MLLLYILILLLVPSVYNLSLNLAFRGQVQLGVEGRDRAFGRRARPSGRPARLAGVPQCRWRVSAPAGRSSPNPARRGGRAGCGGEFAHAPAADQCYYSLPLKQLLGHTIHPWGHQVHSYQVVPSQPGTP